MKAHLVTRPACAPEILTVERAAKELAAEAAGGQSKPIEIPDTKADLIPWINDHAFRAFQDGSADGARAQWEEAEGPRREEMPAPVQAVSRPSPVDTRVDAIEAAIGDASPAALARFLVAAIEQLASTGQPAVTAIRSLIDRQRPAVFFSQGSAVLTLLALGEISTGRKVS